jgi:hypothetical protein
MTKTRGRRRPDFGSDDGFTASWWGEDADFGPPDHQWRSYVRNGEEVARMLLSMRFLSHSDPSASALMVWNFEVREGLQCSGEHIGTTIVEQLVSEYGDREIYIGPTPESVGFWERFRWPMCDCDECDGRNFIVRRP